MTADKERIKVVIIGAGTGGTSILKALLNLNNVTVMGVGDVNPLAEGMKYARERGIITTKNIDELIVNQEADVIIEATGSREVQKKIAQLKRNSVTVMEAKAAHLMMDLVRGQEELTKVKELNARLETILNATQEGVQVVDSNGNVIYVNKAFKEITKLSPEARLGHSIFEVSPYGALAEVVQTHKPVFGKINTIQNTDVEVLSNASPIIVDGKITGAVVVFRDISDIRKMAHHLEKSKEEIKYLKEEINQLAAASYTFNDMIGQSERFRHCITMAQQASDNLSTILITGESGTGKELFAHAIHNYSQRAYKPFIKINCAAIPETLLESELFGYEKGAFSGAVKARVGKFEIAHGGTIFLDEIGDMSFNLQAKLLRVLQEKEVERLGSSYSKKIDVRIIAATNRKLLKLIDAGSFRQDLYYRLNVINIDVPPLRERREDIPLLAEALLNKMNKKFKKDCSLDKDVINMLRSYNWPGNIRELENLLERVVFLADKPSIGTEMLQSYLQTNAHHELDDIVALQEIEKNMIYKALDKYGHSLAGKKKAAEKLKISLATLYNKLDKYKKE